MRIVMVAPARERCGISDYSRSLINALRSTEGIDSVEKIETPDLSPVNSKQAIARYLPLERSFAELARTINDLGPDLVHIQHQFFLFGGVSPLKNHAAGFLKRIVKPVVLTAHETLPNPESALVRTLHRANFMTPNLRAAIVHTTGDAKALEIAGLKQKAITLIPIAAPEAMEMPTSKEAKTQLGLEGHTVITLFGFLSRKKNHSFALDILKRLPERFVLIFAGDRHPDDAGDHVDQLRQRVEAEDLSNRVRFTGYLSSEAMASIFAATDAALAPFTETSGSASIAQLLAQGIPVIGSDIPPLVELDRQAEGAMALASLADIDGFIRLILQFTESSEEHARASRAALSYAAENSLSAIALQHVELYQKVLGKAPTR